jgi:GT2 family glycosyltransferase
VTWNGRRWLDGCLSSVLALDPPPEEVILADNGSTDGSVEYVRQRYPDVTIVALERNFGFAGGNNAGARRASGKYLAFLNNDATVEQDWLAKLVGVAEHDARVGLVTSRIVFMDQPGTIDSAGDGYLRCGGAFKREHGGASGTPSPRPLEVFGACGAAFLIRRELFDRLGGFDEHFFMVYEDVDLSYRARLAGARCVYVPDATVLHAGSPSIGHVSPQQVFYGQRNLEWTWIKNTPSKLLWRSALDHLIYDLAGAAGYARQGHLGVWIRAKFAAVRGLPRVLRQRAVVQRGRRVDPEALWAVMDPNWVRIKRGEKAFDFRARRAG